MNSLSRTRSLHLQVENAIYAMLETMRSGDRLPSEPELAEQLGISRATLREVLRTLVERGHIVRRHGVGTFVASRIPVLDTGLEVLESLSSVSRKQGLETEVAFLETEERLASPVELAGLGCDPEDDLEVLVVNRVIAIESEPVADLRDIIPTRYLRQEDLGTAFSGSVLDLLLARGSPLLSASRTEILAVSAEEKFAKRLQVPVGSALIKLLGQLYAIDGSIVDYSVSYFVPGYFRFHVMRKVQG